MSSFSPLSSDRRRTAASAIVPTLPCFLTRVLRLLEPSPLFSAVTFGIALKPVIFHLLLFRPPGYSLHRLYYKGSSAFHAGPNEFFTVCSQYRSFFFRMRAPLLPNCHSSENLHAEPVRNGPRKRRDRNAEIVQDARTRAATAAYPGTLKGTEFSDSRGHRGCRRETITDRPSLVPRFFPPATFGGLLKAFDLVLVAPLIILSIAAGCGLQTSEGLFYSSIF